MGRRLILGLAVVASVMAPATAALAKGPFDHPVTFSGAVTIDGPHQKHAILLNWKGECGIFDPCSDLKSLDNDFMTVLMDTAATGRIQRYSANFYVRPPASKMGPAYSITWAFTTDDGKKATIRQTYYPYAPQHPWVYSAPRQNLFGTTLDGGWLSTSPMLAPLLQQYGFPTRAVATAATTTVVETTALWPRVLIWSVILGGAVLLLVIGGSVVRRRAAVRAA